jgi:hypothetical protein
VLALRTNYDKKTTVVMALEKDQFEVDEDFE